MKGTRKHALWIALLMTGLLVLCAGPAAAAEPKAPSQVNLIRNGDFAATTGWSTNGQAAFVQAPDDPQKKCVKIEEGGRVSQDVPVVPGRPCRISWRRSGGSHWLYVYFIDAGGKQVPGRGYHNDIRGAYYFPFETPAEGWAAAEQALLAPAGAAKLRITFLHKKGEPSAFIADVFVKEEPAIQMKKPAEDHQVFVEHFESFPEVEANGGRFRPGLTKVDFVPGFKGNAARFSMESGIYYPLKGVLKGLDEGTVEMYVKMEWQKKPVLSDRNVMYVWRALDLGTPTDRVEFMFKFKRLLFRVSGAGRGQAHHETPDLKGWRQFAIVWKANRGQGTDFARLYLDGKRIINIDYIPIRFDPKALEKSGFMTGHGPKGAVCLIDEMKIYNVAKEYTAVDLE